MTLETDAERHSSTPVVKDPEVYFAGRDIGDLFAAPHPLRIPTAASRGTHVPHSWISPVNADVMEYIFKKTDATGQDDLVVVIQVRGTRSKVVLHGLGEGVSDVHAVVGNAITALASRLLTARPKSEGEKVAHEVRELSGLSAEALGDIFPVSRETYQRWLSGAITPSDANLSRLLALRIVLLEARRRQPDARSWLLGPIDGTMETPYDLLRSGQLSKVWDELLRSEDRSTETRVFEDGEWVTETDRPLRVRSDEAQTHLYELDDVDDD